MAISIRDLDNDTRGWIMCMVSGVACVFGAAFICIDFIVRLFPGKRNFRIQESNVFLACSLSLSFGVMLFSALYSMLPESKEYLKKDGWTDQNAGLVMMACFIGGFNGIQVVSRVLHQFMPSHVVDCDHTHADQAAEDAQSNRPASHDRQHSRVSRSRRRFSNRRSSRPASLKHTHGHENGIRSANESTPLLESETNGRPRTPLRVVSDQSAEMAEYPNLPLAKSRTRAATAGPGRGSRRPSMLQVQRRVMSFVKDTKNNCDELGSCYGFTDPCGQECFKHVGSRPANSATRGPTVLQTTTGTFYPASGSAFHGGHEHDYDEHAEPTSPLFRTSRAASREPTEPSIEEVPEDRSVSSVDDYYPPPHHHSHSESHAHDHDHGHSHDHHHDHHITHDDDEDVEAQHHHHVPTNAFMAIGLQTSIAIALHKFPEGFITYATNHANPQLGFNVFMALFVHNISEGFAMCLPLYLALGSRWRAMAWSAVLGGLSQPFGAGLAALWFHVARRSHMTPSPVVYACLFATTSGIMVSVALQLFVESLSLNHDRNLSMFFGFLGMVILGITNAFFAH